MTRKSGDVLPCTVYARITEQEQNTYDDSKGLPGLGTPMLNQAIGAVPLGRTAEAVGWKQGTKSVVSTASKLRCRHVYAPSRVLCLES